MESRPKPSVFLPQKPVDDIQQFFDSMASTVRKFTPLAIARIKLKIAQLVGEEEIAWAELQTTQNYQYVFVPTSESTMPETLTLVQTVTTPAEESKQQQ